MPFAVIPSEEISHRGDFVLLANARGVIDAVEIGVDMGVFAAGFLSRFAGNWLILVDPFDPYPEIPVDRTLDMMVAVQALAPFHGRFRFIRQRSPEAIPLVLKFIQAPGFVYVDGEHNYKDVAADLRGWWGAIRSDGILAGHDWDDEHPEVKRAVEEFARENDIVVRLTAEKTCARSWYCYKTEPDELMHFFFRDGRSVNPHAKTRT
jgi:hypothetical protein